MRRLVLITLLFAFVPSPVTSRGVKEIGPGADWCMAANSLMPGEELRLRPGDYRGPCTLRSGGNDDAPAVISGVPDAERPRIVYESDTDNVVNVYAGGDHQIFLGEVQTAEVYPSEGALLYFRGKYRRLGN